MDFRPDKTEEEAADKKAVELLNNSPYKDKAGDGGPVSEGGAGAWSAAEESHPALWEIAW